MIVHDINRYTGDTITFLSNSCSKDVHNTHQGLESRSEVTAAKLPFSASY